MKRGDAGLTLLELTIAVTVAVPVIGIAVAAITTTLRVSAATEDRYVAGTQAQLLANYLVKDVQSAATLNATTSGACSTGKLLAIRRHDAVVVSYTYGGGRLERRRCDTGAVSVLATALPSTPTFTTTSTDVTVSLTLQDGTPYALSAARRTS